MSKQVLRCIRRTEAYPVHVTGDNLYIGTSAGEILHHVLIPGETPDADSTFILATRLLIPGTPSIGVIGIQQILILPQASKACILCNGTLTFYSLPELSPIYGGKKLVEVAWVGGLDQDTDQDEEEEDYGVDIMICLKSRIRLFRIADEPKTIRHIDIRGCLATSRRGTIACTADNHSYTLVDVVERQQIPLFPISALFEAPEPVSRAVEGTPPRPAQTPRSASGIPTGLLGSTPPGNRYARSSSFNGAQQSPESAKILQSPDRRLSRNPDYDRLNIPPRRSSLEASGLRSASIQRAASPLQHESITSESAPPDSSNVVEKLKPNAVPTRLQPHILTPTSNEFLLTTGTTDHEAGVGIFVNLDGDVVRGTIEFSRYPEAVIVDGRGIDPSVPESPGLVSEEGYVLAIVRSVEKDSERHRIEIQRWDAEQTAVGAEKHWLDISSAVHVASDPSLLSSVGLRRSLSTTTVALRQAVNSLSLKCLRVDDLVGSGEQSVPNEKELSREKGESAFVAQLSTVQTRVMVWSEAQVWWAVRNPLVLRLDAQLHLATKPVEGLKSAVLNRQDIVTVINEVRGKEPPTELDFLGLKYIRQKASVLLFLDLLTRTAFATKITDHDMYTTEEALNDGEIDPRVILLAIRDLQSEVLQGAEGIWLPGGLRAVVEPFLSAQKSTPIASLGRDMLQLVKRFLLHWQRKKGFGSVADEEQVFHSVDAALIRIFLQLDSPSPRGPGAKGSIRAEFASVIDRGVVCFDRAKDLLEGSKRLYLLSRLYQSRKMSAQVLSTWRRILEGEEDASGEFVDGERFLRKYLTKIRDRALVEEYGIWLAAKYPRLGVQVFAEDSSVVKFSPAEAVVILKKGAPDAVKHYLEHLVFGKHLAQYANDLISYYLDSVLGELETNEAARSIVHTSYEAYRAMRPPKPSYSNFAADNAPDAEWWRNRLRLLQLLGGSHGAASKYDVAAVLERVSPHEKELVPEMIILDGRQGRHKEALRLLTHGLGDFDTAVSYCALGGASLYGAISDPALNRPRPSRKEQVELFSYLLEEFIRIEDMSDRISQTSELLTRFAGWFDIGHVRNAPSHFFLVRTTRKHFFISTDLSAAQVLSLVPDTWAVELVAGFLESALRLLVSERNETAIAKALTSAQNLSMHASLIEKLDSFRPVVEDSSQGV